MDRTVGPERAVARVTALAALLASARMEELTEAINRIAGAAGKPDLGYTLREPTDHRPF